MSCRAPRREPRRGDGWLTLTPIAPTGGCGGPTSPSGPGARCARTTAQTATRGPTSLRPRAVRAYRWSEDGMAGLCDRDQRLCFALSFWNGVDPILKERAVRADQPGGQPRRGRQGLLVVRRRDADRARGCAGATTTRSRHSRMTSYVAENARRGRDEPEFELLDTGVFDAGYWAVKAEFAKAGRRRHLHPRHGRRTSVTTAQTLHLLPTLWFRNTWSWEPGAARRRRCAPTTAGSSPSTRRSAPSCWPATARRRAGL